MRVSVSVNFITNLTNLNLTLYLNWSTANLIRINYCIEAPTPTRNSIITININITKLKLISRYNGRQMNNSQFENSIMSVANRNGKCIPKPDCCMNNERVISFPISQSNLLGISEGNQLLIYFQWVLLYFWTTIC